MTKIYNKGCVKNLVKKAVKDRLPHEVEKYKKEEVKAILDKALPKDLDRLVNVTIREFEEALESGKEVTEKDIMWSVANDLKPVIACSLLGYVFNGSVGIDYACASYLEVDKDEITTEAFIREADMDSLAQKFEKYGRK